MTNAHEKEIFAKELKAFAASLVSKIAVQDEWTIRGFVDFFKNVYTISSDTKILMIY